MGDFPSDWEDPGRVPPQVVSPSGKIKSKSTRAGSRIYIPLYKYMKAVGLEEVDKYILRLQNNVAQYITTRPIMWLCLAAERRLGARVSMIW